MIKQKKIYFYSGIGILIFLAIAYFIPVINTETEGSLEILTKTTLLGEIIFYNPFILGIYILIALALIFKNKIQNNE